MVFHPPCTEDELEYDASNSHKETCRVSALVEQPKSPMVEKYGSYDRLTDVVGKAHLAVWSYLYQPILCSCAIVEEGGAGYYEEHHRYILPHVQCYLQTLRYACDVLSRFGNVII